jgi:2-keto-4-pentenoate hydratase/2-oxohepta-3-ene-1,7-dioic acid hydratase in catechol pathway
MAPSRKKSRPRAGARSAAPSRRAPAAPSRGGKTASARRAKPAPKSPAPPSARPKGVAGPLRLVTFSPGKKGALRVGAVTAADRVVDLGAVARRKGIRLAFDPSRMLSLIESGKRGLSQVRLLLALAGDAGAPLDAVRLAAPIPDPIRNVHCVGWNYLEHFEEGKALRDPSAAQALPEHPVFFTKATGAVNGPYDPIPYDPKVSTLIDWETELAVIVGKRGKNVPEEQGMDYVFGFSVLNDTSARDIQQKKHGGQWFKGKGLDGHAPMGPWIVTADGFAHEDLKVVTRVNGVVKQEGSTRQMYFKVPRLVAELSLGMTIHPGDILSTGTPPGIGHARKPPQYLVPGDVMESEIEGIGTLRNPIRAV